MLNRRNFINESFVCCLLPYINISTDKEDIFIEKFKQEWQLRHMPQHLICTIFDVYYNKELNKIVGDFSFESYDNKYEHYQSTICFCIKSNYNTKNNIEQHLYIIRNKLFDILENKCGYCIKSHKDNYGLLKRFSTPLYLPVGYISQC